MKSKRLLHLEHILGGNVFVDYYDGKYKFMRTDVDYFACSKDDVLATIQGYKSAENWAYAFRSGRFFNEV